MGRRDDRSHSAYADVCPVVDKYQEDFLASAAPRDKHREAEADRFLGVEDMFDEGCRLVVPVEGHFPSCACADY